jgi:hypothetical protein
MVDCIVHLTIPLSAEGERQEWEADIESAGFTSKPSITSFSGPVFVHIPEHFIDSKPVDSLCSWRELIEREAYRKVEKADSWQRVDTTED